jgi:signal transduction histidine kinase/FixJ family two-component response regulator/purine-cytosine permease-like protein
MTAHQRIVRVRRDYNKWVVNEMLEDYALRFTAERSRRWSSWRVANTAIGAISFLALEAIGGTITLTYGFTNAATAIVVVGAILFAMCLPVSFNAAKYGIDIDLLTRGAGFGYLGSTITSIVYACFTFIFFAIEAAIMATALEMGLGVPLPVGYVVCALGVIPLVTYGFTFISRFQLWTQPVWIVMHILPFLFIGLFDASILTRWMSYTGRLGPLDNAFSLPLFGAAAGVVFSLVTQIGEQVDFLRFLPPKRRGRQFGWWLSLISAGPGWIVLGTFKLLAGSFLAYLALSHGVPPADASEPTHMYVVAFGYVAPDTRVALGLAVTFVIISQLKINVTNSYAGSIAWSNFFSRLTHSHPGRVVWLVFNVLIALLLMELGIYKALERILGIYAFVAVAWVAAIVADLSINKPLGLRPPGIEFQRAHLYDINPVGFGAMTLAILFATMAYAGCFGHVLQSMSSFVALITALVASPLIACATRGRYYVARTSEITPTRGKLATCCICEHDFETHDMAFCPAYAGPICSLCCTLDARCNDLCKTDSRVAHQMNAAAAAVLPERVVRALQSNLGRYLGLLALVMGLLGAVLGLVYWQTLLEGQLSSEPLAAVLSKVFAFFLLICGILCWLFVLVQESREVAQEESQRQTRLLTEEIEAHKRTDIALQRAKEAAEAANLAKSRYVVGISHEFRTPLNAILGYAQLMERDCAMPAGRQNAVRTIRRAGEHLAGLVDGLLDIAKIEAGRLELERDDLNFPELINQLVDMFRMQAETKGIGFVHITKGRIPDWVRIDAKRLRQVLINLLSNALKFTERGEIRFVIDYRDDIVRFIIEDTGCGIAESDLERIFIPFERIEPESGTWIPGTGLGLTITKLMAEIMGGNISVQSERRVGSTFTVKLYLPGVEHHGEAHNEIALIEGYAGRRITVLVADDDANHRELIDNILRPFGFIVFAVADGPACLSLADEFRPQLILLDVNMPAMSGWDVARQLRENGHRDCKIIMLSADATKANQPRQADDPYDDFLSKPFDLSRLLERIGTLLRIEWTYAHSAAPAAAPKETGIAYAFTSAERAELLQLARIGYAKGFLRRLAQIKQVDAATISAINTLKTLAAELRFEEIAKRLEGDTTVEQHA